MQTHHDWSRSMRRLEAIIERCLALRAGEQPERALAAQPH